MAMKRPAAAKAGRAKKVKTDYIGPIVEAITEAEGVDTGCKSLLAVALPLVLQTPKVDRHAYEVEVVSAAETCLSTIEADMEARRKAAHETQAAICAPAEKSKREGLVQEKAGAVKEAKLFCESKISVKQQCAATAQEGENAVKAAQKAAKQAETDLLANIEKKRVLDDAALADMQTLRHQSSATAPGSAALKNLIRIGKANNFDATMLQSFSLACKKKPADRTDDFDHNMFSEYQKSLNQHHDELKKKTTELEEDKVQKIAAVEAAKKVLVEAEEKVAAASEEVKNAQAVVKSAQVAEKEAKASLSSMWPEVKIACETADQLAKDLQTFKEVVMANFGICKEKVAEPTEEEAEEEEQEEKQEEQVEEAAMDETTKATEEVENTNAVEQASTEVAEVPASTE